jgi:hypothetical protein
MDSDTSSTLILIAIIAAAIMVPLILIGLVVVLALPAVRRRRAQWQTAAASLGLQCDPMCMHGFRGAPVRIFWTNEGATTGQMDMTGVVLAGRYEMRGGRAGLRYTYCRALLEPPLRLGVAVARKSGAETAGKIRTGRSEFDDAFTLLAREGGHAQQLFASTVADDFAIVARNGWQISATDNYVQIRIGGDYSAQFPEREPGILSAALDNAVHCAQSLIVARRALPLTATEQNFAAAWQRTAPLLGLRVDQAMLEGTYAGHHVEVYVDCIEQREWRTVFTVAFQMPQPFSLYLTRKGTIDRIWGPRGKQVVEIIRLGDPNIEQAFSVCGSNQSAPTPQTRQQLQRLCTRAVDVVIEDCKVEVSAPGFISEANDLREILDAMTSLT